MAWCIAATNWPPLFGVLHPVWYAIMLFSTLTGTHLKLKSGAPLNKKPSSETPEGNLSAKADDTFQCLN